VPCFNNVNVFQPGLGVADDGGRYRVADRQLVQSGSFALASCGATDVELPGIASSYSGQAGLACLIFNLGESFTFVRRKLVHNLTCGRIAFRPGGWQAEFPSAVVATPTRPMFGELEYHLALATQFHKSESVAPIKDPRSLMEKTFRNQNGEIADEGLQMSNRLPEVISSGTAENRLR
jgi:hypothetical protein